MDERTEADLVHSVVFRVMEAQWLKLQRRAQQEGTTVPQMAKAALFDKVGVEATVGSRRGYGQEPRRKREARRGG